MLFKMSNDDDEKFKKEYENGSYVYKLINRTAYRLGRIIQTYFVTLKYRDLDLLSRHLNLNNRFSLPEGSIIANPLYAPDSDGNFTRFDSKSGTYSSIRFSPKVKRERDMTIGGFRLDEFIDNSQDQLTPTLSYSPVSLEDKLNTDFSALPKLLEHGFLVQTTLGEAYRRKFPEDVSLQEGFSKLGVSDNLAYQVTPKGNSLVLLFMEGGNKEPKPQPYREGSINSKVVLDG